jgi:hypothetical protein
LFRRFKRLPPVCDWSSLQIIISCHIPLLFFGSMARDALPIPPLNERPNGKSAISRWSSNHPIIRFKSRDFAAMLVTRGLTLPSSLPASCPKRCAAAMPMFSHGQDWASRCALLGLVSPYVFPRFPGVCLAECHCCAWTVDLTCTVHWVNLGWLVYILKRYASARTDLVYNFKDWPYSFAEPSWWTGHPFKSRSNFPGASHEENGNDLRMFFFQIPWCLKKKLRRLQKCGMFLDDKFCFVRLIISPFSGDYRAGFELIQEENILVLHPSVDISTTNP